MSDYRDSEALEGLRIIKSHFRIKVRRLNVPGSIGLYQMPDRLRCYVMVLFLNDIKYAFEIEYANGVCWETMISQIWREVDFLLDCYTGTPLQRWYKLEARKFQIPRRI